MRKMLVLGDSHGRKYLIKEAIERNKNCFDYLFHLGDFSQDMIDFLNQGIQTYVVRGNMDPFIPRTDFAANELKIEIEGLKIWAIHGHQYEVHNSTEKLYKKAIEENINLVLFGHTHSSEFSKRENLFLFNPGALKERSYGIITINNKEIDAKILNL